jgi:hypothetical protein
VHGLLYKTRRENKLNAKISNFGNNLYIHYRSNVWGHLEISVFL